MPADALLERADELATRWAIALILARPLDSIGGVPLEDLAHEAPALCAQVVRALQSDIELDRLTGRATHGARESSAAALRLAEITAARDPRAVVDAVEALRGVVWEALLDHLSPPACGRSSARVLADISDRLACVCAAALAAALDVTPVAGVSARDEHAHGVVRTASATACDPAMAQPPAARAVIVDERAPVAAVQHAARAPGVAGEIEIRDQRSDEGPTAWIRSIGAQLQRFGDDGVPFAVLLIELVDIERLRRDEHADELASLAAQTEHALTAELASGSASLTRERPGRCWVLVPEIDRAGVRQLAERLARVVASSASVRSAPLDVAIGTAVCPADGREAAALAAHADVGLYAARAAVRASAIPASPPVRPPQR